MRPSTAATWPPRSASTPRTWRPPARSTRRELPKEKRNSLFEISCVTPENLDEYTKYDEDIDGWIDTLIENGPWDTEPVPLVGGGPEVLPGS